jgi:tungstate transport system substrate-binding protein
MPRRFALVFTLVILLTTVLSACTPAGSAPAQQPASTAAAQAAPTSAPAPTTAPEPTRAPEPTLATAPTTAPAANAEPTKLILATTTSTQDSGLLDYLLPDFEKKYNAKVDVVAVGTGQALEIGGKGDADVLLVHSRKGEDQFVKDGNAKQRYDVMYNDFIVVGSKEDPAKIKDVAVAKDAFKKIADEKATFVSRGDKSGTNTKELSIWSSIPFTPTKDMTWYNSIGQGMGDTLVFTNEKQGYTLTDRGTWLSMKDKLPNLEILLGGASLAENKDKALLNPYGVLPVNPDKFSNVKADLAQKFVDWILSPEVQKMIGEYGADKYGQPLFYANAQK